MRKYLVTFHKVVLDGTGHDRRVLQRQAVVRSCSDVAARYEAKAMFCQSLRIADWRLQADTCEVVELIEMVA